MAFFSYTDDAGVLHFGEDSTVPKGATGYQNEPDWLQAQVEARQPLPLAIPDRCSKLGLKRALAETGADAVFKTPEWPAVKAAIASNEDLQEDWDLATVIVRTDPLVQAMIAARKYDDATVDKILARANVLSA